MSLWYMQYMFWFLRDGSPPILFGHLKNDSFLIRSIILCTSSLNTTFTPSICASGSCILKSFFGLFGKMPCRDRPSNGPYPYSTANHLRDVYTHSSICLINYLISSRGLFISDSHSSESSGSPILKVVAAILSLPLPISLYSSQYQLA